MAQEVGTVDITLERASGLPNVEVIGFVQDPYVVVKVDGQTARSQTHKDGGIAPIWNQRFEFKGVSADAVITMQLYDENVVLRDKLIGSCRIPLKQVKPGRLEVPVLAKNKHRGYVEVALNFHVTEAEAHKLPRIASSAAAAAALGMVEKPSKGGNWILPTYGGKDVKSEYSFGKVLGKGTFGITYLVTEKVTGQKLACKTISKRKMSTPEEIEDVRFEVQIMHHLAGHENVVRLRGVYEDRSSIHLVMELCNGGELFDRIVARGHYSEMDAAAIMKPIVSVIAYCHAMGVIHRDLKPENFLLLDKSDNATLKATDFGLSSFFEEGQQFTDIVGSAYYVAPEVLRRKYSKEADIWSLGVILYILLSGVPPFYGENEDAIFRSVLKDSPDFTSTPWPRISPEAQDLVKKMLVRDPARRATAEQVLQHSWLHDQGVASDQPLQLEVVSRLRNFAAMNRLKKEALKLIAGYLPLEEVEGLRAMFASFDKDGSGNITVDELREGVKKKGGRIPEGDLQQLMADADVSGDGLIDYNEFLAATISACKLEREEHLKAAFQHFDQDGNGSITKEELLLALDGLGIHDVQDILEEADLNKDGVIDYNEFCSLLRQN